MQSGTLLLIIGSLTLELSDTLYSSNSACNIILAVRLKKEHNIVAASNNQLLVKINKNKPDIPVARLIENDGVPLLSHLKKFGGQNPHWNLQHQMSQDCHPSQALTAGNNDSGIQDNIFSGKLLVGIPRWYYITSFL